MKKLIMYLFFASSVVLVQAASNTMNMVTYFPVPYVAYNAIKVDKELDVGLGSKDCRLNLGCASSTNIPLSATNLNLNSGSLFLEPGNSQRILNQNTTIGSASSTTNIADIKFKHSLGVNKDFEAKSLNSSHIDVDNLVLFGKPFPSCKSDVQGSDGQMSWARLALGPNKDQTEIYLQCGGTSGSSSCPPTHEGKTSYTVACPEGQTGTITYTWDSNNCKYIQTTSSCESPRVAKEAIAECAITDTPSNVTEYPKTNDQLKADCIKNLSQSSYFECGKALTVYPGESCNKVTGGKQKCYIPETFKAIETMSSPNKYKKGYMNTIEC